MRMSVTLDEKLMKEAQVLSGKKIKREVIDEALTEYVRKRRREGAVRHAGKINIDLTLKGLYKLRESK
ncbi:MAG: type II toxin-antitoxin system VapB family antitoxin [Thermodesulfovibrionales bacterium]|nr:type II toxin-antitoxin system VapB family antitoxin [Thermodesulfovibrionales bacterium]